MDFMLVAQSAACSKNPQINIFLFPLKQSPLFSFECTSSSIMIIYNRKTDVLLYSIDHFGLEFLRKEEPRDETSPAAAVHRWPHLSGGGGIYELQPYKQPTRVYLHQRYLVNYSYKELRHVLSEVKLSGDRARFIKHSERNQPLDQLIRELTNKASRKCRDSTATKTLSFIWPLRVRETMMK